VLVISNSGMPHRRRSLPQINERSAVQRASSGSISQRFSAGVIRASTTPLGARLNALLDVGFSRSVLRLWLKPGREAR
jgi:hypothetical protein